MSGAVGNLDPSHEIIALFGCTRIHGEAVLTHQGRKILREFKMGFLDFIRIQHPVTVLVVTPRMPKVDIGMGWKMGSVGDGENNRCSRSDVSTVKPLHGTVDQGRRHVIKQERLCGWKGAEDVLPAQRHHLNAQIKRGAAERYRVREQRHTIVEYGGGGVFISINEEANQRLP